MDHVGGRVEQSTFAAVDDLAGVVHEDEVGLVDHGESDPEWVHPEAVRLHGVTHGDVASHALVEAIFAENAEGGCEAAFEVVALLVWVVELGWSAMSS